VFQPQPLCAPTLTTEREREKKIQLLAIFGNKERKRAFKKLIS
jgi:hypothetical protein